VEISSRKLLRLAAQTAAIMLAWIAPPGASGQDEHPPFAIRERVAGRHGGEKLVLELHGPSWDTVFAPPGKDELGDPRWFRQLLGEDVGRFLGFETLGPRLETIPDARELDGGIAAINRRLTWLGHESILLRFAAHDSNDLARYVTGFPRLPYEDSGLFVVHDAAFHAPSILMPNTWIEHAQRQNSVIAEWNHVISANRPTFEKMAWNSRSAGLDVGTANLKEFLDSPSRLQEMGEALTLEGRSPRAALEITVERILRDEDADPVLRRESNLALKAVHDRHRSDPYYEQNLTLDGATAQEHVFTKRERIRQAVSAIEAYRCLPHKGLGRLFR